MIRVTQCGLIKCSHALVRSWRSCQRAFQPRTLPSSLTPLTLVLRLFTLYLHGPSFTQRQDLLFRMGHHPADGAPVDALEYLSRYVPAQTQDPFSLGAD